MRERDVGERGLEWRERERERERLGEERERGRYLKQGIKNIKSVWNIATVPSQIQDGTHTVAQLQIFFQNCKSE